MTTTKYRIPLLKIQLVKDGTEIAEVNTIGSPADVNRILRDSYQCLDREAVRVLLLNTKNRVIGINTVSVGDLSSSIVHPREVFKAAILANAASIILTHNHPSGDPAPSAEDKAMTRKIADAGELLGISLLDHVVIGNDCFVSLKERGCF